MVLGLQVCLLLHKEVPEGVEELHLEALWPIQKVELAEKEGMAESQAQI